MRKGSASVCGIVRWVTAHVPLSMRALGHKGTIKSMFWYDQYIGEKHDL